MINKSAFEQQKFKSHEIQEKPLKDEESALLRERIRDIGIEQSDLYRAAKKVKMSDYSFVQEFCSIPEDIYKKTINGKIKITRSFIAKFTIGLQLGVDGANELFTLHSGELDMSNAFDFVVYHALAEEDDIENFTDETQRYLKININK